MHTMFLTVWPLALMVTLSACATAAEKEVSFYVSNRLEDFSIEVYVGADSDMPIGGEFKLAIQPTRDDSGKFLAPTSLRSMLREMHQMLPHWYINALITSEGDNECSVTVNDIGYSTLVMSWIWVNWGFESQDSPLRKELESLGVQPGSERVIMTSAIESGFCELVKNGDERKAIQEIARYGDIHTKKIDLGEKQ